MGEGKVIHVDFKNRKVNEIEKSPPSPYADRFEHFSKLIAKSKVRVAFPSAYPGVKVHDVFKTVPIVILDWSHLYGLADFTYDAAGVGGTLSVRGVNEYVYVPWEAMISISAPGNPETEIQWDVIYPALPSPVVSKNESPIKVVGPDTRTRIRETVLRIAQRILKGRA